MPAPYYDTSGRALAGALAPLIPATAKYADQLEEQSLHERARRETIGDVLLQRQMERERFNRDLAARVAVMQTEAGQSPGAAEGVDTGITSALGALAPEYARRQAVGEWQKNEPIMQALMKVAEHAEPAVQAPYVPQTAPGGEGGPQEDASALGGGLGPRPMALATRQARTARELTLAMPAALAPEAARRVAPFVGTAFRPKEPMRFEYDIHKPIGQVSAPRVRGVAGGGTAVEQQLTQAMRTYAQEAARIDPTASARLKVAADLGDKAEFDAAVATAGIKTLGPFNDWLDVHYPGLRSVWETKYPLRPAAGARGIIRYDAQGNRLP